MSSAQGSACPTPKRHQEYEGDDRSCTLCVAEFYEGDRVIRLKSCRHVFHANCWYGYYQVWLTTKKDTIPTIDGLDMQCPNCRGPPEIGATWNFIAPKLDGQVPIHLIAPPETKMCLGNLNADTDLDNVCYGACTKCGAVPCSGNRGHDPFCTMQGLQKHLCENCAHVEAPSTPKPSKEEDAPMWTTPDHGMQADAECTADDEFEFEDGPTVMSDSSLTDRSERHGSTQGQGGHSSPFASQASADSGGIGSPSQPALRHATSGWRSS